MRAKTFSQNWSMRERSDTAQRHVVDRNTSGWLNCMPFEYIKIHYISIWFDRMFSLNWKKSSQRSRECQWVYKNEEKTQLSLSSRWIVNLEKTLRFVNAQKSYKQEKRRQRKLFWTNNYRVYQGDNSLMKKLCICLIDCKFALILFKS